MVHLIFRPVKLQTFHKKHRQSTALSTLPWSFALVFKSNYWGGGYPGNRRVGHRICRRLPRSQIYLLCAQHRAFSESHISWEDLEGHVLRVASQRQRNHTCRHDMTKSEHETQPFVFQQNFINLHKKSTFMYNQLRHNKQASRKG